MVIVAKHFKKKNEEIKSYGGIPPTDTDIKKADKLDKLMSNLFERIDGAWIKLNNKDPLDLWYLTGKEINRLFESKEFKILRIPKYDLKNVFSAMDSVARTKFNKLFKLKDENTRRDTLLRNLFYRAYRLSFQPYDDVKKLASWDTWREFLERPIFDRDPRFLKLLLTTYYENCHTKINREQARKLIKEVNKRYNKIATEYISDLKLKDAARELIAQIGCR
jgi:hypothetical protein